MLNEISCCCCCCCCLFRAAYKAGLFINLEHGICDSSILNFYCCYWDINFVVRWQVPKITSFCIFI
jgi:hypothetical protein